MNKKKESGLSFVFDALDKAKKFRAAAAVREKKLKSAVRRRTAVGDLNRKKVAASAVMLSRLADKIESLDIPKSLISDLTVPAVESAATLMYGTDGKSLVFVDNSSVATKLRSIAKWDSSFYEQCC